MNYKKLFTILFIIYTLFNLSNLHAGILRSTTFDDRPNCEESLGVWREFGNSCVDRCEFQFDPYVVCASAITFGCECGKDRCMFQDKCIRNIDYQKIYDEQSNYQKKLSSEDKEKRAKIALKFKNTYINKLSGIYNRDPNYKDPNYINIKKELPPNSFNATNRTLIYNDLIKKRNERIMLIKKEYENKIADLKKSENPDKDLIDELSKSMNNNKILQYMTEEIPNQIKKTDKNDIQKEPIVLQAIDDSKNLDNNKLIDNLSNVLNPNEAGDMLSNLLNKDKKEEKSNEISELPPVYVRPQNGDKDFKDNKVIDNADPFPQFVN